MPLALPQSVNSVIFAVMNFGPLTLKSNLFLSPLAGYTNLPFRLVVREVGGVGLCTTDLVNARSLLEKNKKALKLIESSPADTPLAVQLFGAVPESIVERAPIFVGEHLVSQVDLFEPIVGRRIVLIAVGMVLRRKSLEGALDLLGGCVAMDSEDLVVVPLRHASTGLSSTP